LRTEDRVVDLVSEGIDLSIRLGWLKNSSQWATKLGEFEQYIVAASQYLQKVSRSQHETLLMLIEQRQQGSRASVLKDRLTDEKRICWRERAYSDRQRDYWKRLLFGQERNRSRGRGRGR
jgi:DNA-binding transcriptional LysR family regulator